MVLFIIGFIFSIIGILGVILNNTTLIVVGLIVIIIDDLIDIFGSNTNPTTVVLAIIFAIGASFANHNPLASFTISLCTESFVMSVLGIVVILKNFSKKHKNSL